MEMVLVVKCCNCLGYHTRSREVGLGQRRVFSYCMWGCGWKRLRTFSNRKGV